MVRSLAACGLHKGTLSKRLRLRVFHRRVRRALTGRSARATVIPISGGNTDRQIMVMKDFGVTAICCTPATSSTHRTRCRIRREHEAITVARRGFWRGTMD